MKIIIFILILLINFELFSFEIEDTTLNKDKKIKVQNTNIQKNKNSLSDEKRDVKNISNKTSDNSEKSTNPKEESESLDYIMIKAEDYGRVFVIPSLSYNASFTGGISNFFMPGVEFEYNLGILNNSLSLYGNISFGIMEKYFMANFDGGIKYNLPRLTRFLKFYLKTGILARPYFTADEVIMPSALVFGAGFKFFITDDFAFEESQDFQVGSTVNDSNFYMMLRFKLGIIWVF
jgi:hypothetical protein